MITKISKIKSFGIFQDYSSSRDLKPFVQYNIFYGWNGSGKSTFAKVFLSLSDKKIYSDFPNGEFSISILDCPDTTHKNVAQNTSNIRVFNGDFVNRNVNFEQSKANSILILSEEKKEELDRYKLLLADLFSKENSYQSDLSTYNKSTDDLKKNLSKWASSIKKSFELIETSNSYYLNYDRTKLNNFIRDQRAKITSTSVLSADDVKDLKNAIKPTQKNDINTELYSNIELEEMLNLVSRTEALLSTSIFSQQIDRLTANLDINRWVQDGIGIHLNHESKNCEFCGQELPQERIEQLNKHFSKEYDSLLTTIKSLDEQIDQLLENGSINAPDTGEFYEELHSQFESARTYFIDKKTSYVTKLQEIKSKVEKKNANPFDVINFKFSGIENVVNDYNDGLQRVMNLIVKHNKKNQGFEDAVRAAQFSLELHFVSDILISEKYDEVENAIKTKKISVDKKLEEVTDLKAKVLALEAILLNEAVGAEEFNRNLAKFIGRKDLSLEFDRNLKGYKLIRKGKTEPARNLSEGEKTAIALVYFMSKLKENGNQIENTIILLDDPISSFDSNHLFHSYSYLKKECEKAQQLFILTHNFQYFKLLRDWLIKKNEKKRKPDGTYEDKIRTNIYSIDCTVEEDRKASIVNADTTLLSYNSEYHYIFQKLLSFKDVNTLDLEKAFLIANLSRKLLESFLTFKFPKGRNDFSQLLQAGCTDQEIREKVYRFINKYSHNQVIDFNDGPIDNLLGEGNNIVNSVLKIVEDLDTTHYSEMSEICVQ